MRYAALLFVCVLAIFAAASCQPKQTRLNPQPAEDPLPTPDTRNPKPRASDNNEPLLLLDDDEPPLLLDDDGEATGPIADNSRCFVCHLNYMNEDLAVVHARANIGCQGCHGESSPHIADESWAEGGNGTAPEIMYPREKIDPACMECHPREKIDTKDHKPFLDGIVKGIVCTDCHGKHRLETRKLIWK